MVAEATNGEMESAVTVYITKLDKFKEKVANCLSRAEREPTSYIMTSFKYPSFCEDKYDHFIHNALAYSLRRM